MNPKDKKLLLNEFKKLLSILNKTKMEYTMIAGSLLGTKEFGGMIPWDDDIDVAISYDLYKYLLKNYPDNIVKSNDEGYPLMFPKWVPDKSNISNTNVFIDLFVIVHTTKKKWKKYRSIRNAFKYGVYAVHNGYKPFNLPIKIFKFITYPFKFFFKENIDFDETCERLYDPKGDQKFLIVNPAEPNYKCDLRGVNLETEWANFEGMKVKAIKDHKHYFNIKYGKVSLNPPKKIEIHVNTFNVIEGEWDGK